MGEMIARGLALFFLAGICILMVATWVGYFASRVNEREMDQQAAERQVRVQEEENRNRQRMIEQHRFRQNAARLAREAEALRQQELLNVVVAGLAQDRAAYKERYGGK